MFLKEKFGGFIPSLRRIVLGCTMSFIPGELLYPCSFCIWTCSSWFELCDKRECFVVSQHCADHVISMLFELPFPPMITTAWVLILMWTPGAIFH